MDGIQTNPTIPSQGNVVSPVEATPIKTGKKSVSRLVIGLVVFLIFLLGVVGYLVYQNYLLKQQTKLNLSFNPTPTSISPSLNPSPSIMTTSSPLPDITSDWIIYKNEKYGYQFKYPNEWSFSIQLESDQSKPLYVIRETITSKIINNYSILISSWENPDKLSLVNWLQFMKNSNALTLPTDDVQLVSNFEVANQPAFKIWDDPISQGRLPGQCVQACPILDVYLVNNNKAYRIELNYSQEVDQASQDVFLQLLSTFQFI